MTKKQQKRNFTKGQKIVGIVLAIIFLFVIIYSTTTLAYRNGKTKITIRVAPNSAVITMNGTRVSNNSSIWLIPGEYNLKITAGDHLETYETTYTVKDTSAELYLTLNAKDDEGREFIDKHKQEYTVVEGLIGNLENTLGERKKQQYPILRHLPINNTFYSISYEYDENDAPVITIKTTLEFVDVAVKRLKTFTDVNISELNINFNLDNPYASYNSNTKTDVNDFLKTAFNLKSDQIIDEIKTHEEYYYTTIHSFNQHDGDEYAHYLVVLKKNNSDEWDIITTPQPILTTYNSQNIPKEVLDIINSY